MTQLSINQLTITLRRTLANYKNYQATAMVWLQKLRMEYIPVEVSQVQEHQVCKTARVILEGKCPEFRGMNEQMRLAAAMLACQVWVDSILDGSVSRDTENFLVQYLRLIPPGHFLLAIRNAGGGKETPVSGKVIGRMCDKDSQWASAFRDCLIVEINAHGRV